MAVLGKMWKCRGENVEASRKNVVEPGKNVKVLWNNVEVPRKNV